MAHLDRTLLRRLVTLAKPFFVGDARWRARSLILLLITFSISIKGLDVLMSYVGRDFMTALHLRDRTGFVHHLYRYLGMFAIATPVIVFYRYTEERLGLLWR